MDSRSAAYAEDHEVTPRDRNAIVEQYLGLVRRIAQRIAMRLPPTVDLDDLVSDGVIGLIDAIEKYDESKNDSFKKYAQIRIQGAILDGIRSYDWAPRSFRRRSARVRRVKETLEKDLGRPPTPEEMADHLGFSRDAYEAFMRRLEPILVLSLEELRTDRDGATKDASPFLQDRSTPDPLLEAQRAQAFETMLECIEELKERQRQVVVYYYFHDMKFREVGDMLGITESRVSQIHSLALQKLKLKVYKRIRDQFSKPYEA